MEHFLKKYRGPRGKHLKNLSYQTKTGKPWNEHEDFHPTKRPGRMLMRMMGRPYNPKKRLKEVEPA